MASCVLKKGCKVSLEEWMNGAVESESCVA